MLVGHSYGGMVVTDAAAGHENVRHLVYVTFVMPERGETMAGLGGVRTEMSARSVVPSSGTGELRGLRGTVRVLGPDGRHTFTVDYHFEL